MDNIRTTILQCRLVIAEITDRNPNVMYELGLALEGKKSIILLSQTDIPPDLVTFHHILYKNTAEGFNILYSRLQSEIERLLFEDPLIQAKQLMDKGFFGPAVITIMSYLDRCVESLLGHIQDLPPGKRNFRSMIKALVELKIIDNQQMEELTQWRAIRNSAVHGLIYPKQEQTVEIIYRVEILVNYLRSMETPAYLWWKVLKDHERKELTERFLVTLYRLSNPKKEHERDGLPIASKLIFGAMKLNAYSDTIVPIIVKTLEIDEYITIADEGRVQLAEKGKIKSRQLLEIK